MYEFFPLTALSRDNTLSDWHTIVVDANC
jgi:hypothetical protein